MRPAGTVIVDTCDDSGTGSLRDAVVNAVDGTIIDLTDLTCSFISVDSGAIAATVPHLTILGPGQDALTIDAGNASRVFASAYDLTVADVTITHGVDVGGLGGCIRVEGDLVLTRSTVTKCHAGDGSGLESRGGAVSVGGYLTLYSSTISMSDASAVDNVHGGGLHVEGSAYMYDSVVEGNTALAQAYYARGGGVFVASNALVSNTRIGDNRVESIGGATYGGGIVATAAFVASSTITGNTAHSETRWSYGGGIHAGGGGIALIGTTLGENTASANCNACYIAGGGANATGQINALYSTIRDNEVLANPDSGGIASGGGLATYADGDAGKIEIRNTTISGNAARGGNNGGRGHGGGLAALVSPFVATSSTIAFNDATHAGGGAIGNDIFSNPVLNSTLLTNNQAPEGADLAPTIAGNTVTIAGSNNLVMNASADIALPSDTLDADPGLLALQNNGGATETHALPANSPAIDTGNHVEPLDYDQRGCPFARVVNGAADIGAFELQVDTTEVVFRDGFEELVPCD